MFQFCVSFLKTTGIPPHMFVCEDHLIRNVFPAPFIACERETALFVFVKEACVCVNPTIAVWFSMRVVFKL